MNSKTPEPSFTKSKAYVPPNWAPDSSIQPSKFIKVNSNVKGDPIIYFISLLILLILYYFVRFFKLFYRNANEYHPVEPTRAFSEPV